MTTTRELLAQIYQHSQVGTMEEAKDPGEYDQEGGMAKGQLKTMIDAAQELGLEKSVAQKLVAQTIIGAGETGKDINDLGNEIIKVSSKGGTTEKAIDVFKQKKIDAIIKQAVKAAHKRSKELSK